jgi:hypothetical protein
MPIKGINLGLWFITVCGDRFVVCGLWFVVSGAAVLLKIGLQDFFGLLRSDGWVAPPSRGGSK